MGVRKHTNCILILDKETAETIKLGANRIDGLESCDWLKRVVETIPTERIEPEYVRLPFITNRGFEDTIHVGEPVVGIGDIVETGDVIGSPSTEESAFLVAGIDEPCITIRSHMSANHPRSELLRGSQQRLK